MGDAGRAMSNNADACRLAFLRALDLKPPDIGLDLVRHLQENAYRLAVADFPREPAALPGASMHVLDWIVTHALLRCGTNLDPDRRFRLEGGGGSDQRTGWHRVRLIPT